MVGHTIAASTDAPRAAEARAPATAATVGRSLALGRARRPGSAPRGRELVGGRAPAPAAAPRPGGEGRRPRGRRRRRARRRGGGGVGRLTACSVPPSKAGARTSATRAPARRGPRARRPSSRSPLASRQAQRRVAPWPARATGAPRGPGARRGTRGRCPEGHGRGRAQVLGAERRPGPRRRRRRRRHDDDAARLRACASARSGPRAAPRRRRRRARRRPRRARARRARRRRRRRRPRLRQHLAGEVAQRPDAREGRPVQARRRAAGPRGTAAAAAARGRAVSPAKMLRPPCSSPPPAPPPAAGTGTAGARPGPPEARFRCGRFGFRALGRDDGASSLPSYGWRLSVASAGGAAAGARVDPSSGGALLRLLAPQGELPPRRRGRRLGLDDGDTVCAGRLRHWAPAERVARDNGAPLNAASLWRLARCGCRSASRSFCPGVGSVLPHEICSAAAGEQQNGRVEMGH